MILIVIDLYSYFIDSLRTTAYCSVLYPYRNAVVDHVPSQYNGEKSKEREKRVNKQHLLYEYI